MWGMWGIWGVCGWYRDVWVVCRDVWGYVRMWCVWVVCRDV